MKGYLMFWTFLIPILLALALLWVGAYRAARRHSEPNPGRVLAGVDLVIAVLLLVGFACIMAPRLPGWARDGWFGVVVCLLLGLVLSTVLRSARLLGTRSASGSTHEAIRREDSAPAVARPSDHERFAWVRTYPNWFNALSHFVSAAVAGCLLMIVWKSAVLGGEFRESLDQLVIPGTIGGAAYLAASMIHWFVRRADREKAGSPS